MQAEVQVSYRCVEIKVELGDWIIVGRLRWPDEVLGDLGCPQLSASDLVSLLSHLFDLAWQRWLGTIHKVHD